MVASGWVSYVMWSLTRERSVSGQWWSAATSVVLRDRLMAEHEHDMCPQRPVDAEVLKKIKEQHKREMETRLLAAIIDDDSVSITNQSAL